jgi:hypothetical protein
LGTACDCVNTYRGGRKDVGHAVGGAAGIHYRSPQAVVLEPQRRATVATVSSLEHALAGVLTDLDRPLAVDLAELADCDGAGTCVLIAAARVTATRDRHDVQPVAAGPPTSHVHRLPAALGVLEALPAFHTIDTIDAPGRRAAVCWPEDAQAPGDDSASADSGWSRPGLSR